MKYSFKQLLTLGIIAELIILLVSFYFHPEKEETFRYAARYSGRVSLVVFLISFYLYTTSYPKALNENLPLRSWIKLFAILHIIHFCFLATNIYLNNIELVPIRLLGGFIAYLMIIIAPFWLHRVNFKIQLIYFYYVSLVMILTYVARVKGGFEGAKPYWIHYFGLGILILCSIIFGWILFKSNKKN